MKSTSVSMATRTMEEITASVKLNMQDMVNRAIALGLDLIEAKEACGHGRWLPWLKSVGISSSTAANYMRIASEVTTDSKMAQLPYTKVLALLALPPEEREEVAEAAENMSAAEIRRLTEERNKAAAAANSETARADQAEADAKRFYSENAKLRTDMMNLQAKLERAENLQQHTADSYRHEIEKSRDLRAKLLIAENNRIEVEVEKIPEDYEQLKADLAAARKTAQEMINAAAEAEERANAAETEMEEMRNVTKQADIDEYEKMHYAMKVFFASCELLALKPDRLIPQREKARRDAERMRQWAETLITNLDGCAIAAEGEAMVV